MAIASFKDLCLDAGDALGLARFWHRLLGGRFVNNRGGRHDVAEPGGDIGWWVLADPEGNEFCAFPPR